MGGVGDEKRYLLTPTRLTAVVVVMEVVIVVARLGVNMVPT